MARHNYDPERIETKWQKVWAEQKTFEVTNPEPGESPTGKGKDATYAVSYTHLTLPTNREV